MDFWEIETYIFPKREYNSLYINELYEMPQGKLYWILLYFIDRHNFHLFNDK
jgi:hypothetical protein